MSKYVGFVPGEDGSVGAWMLSSPHGAPVYVTPKGSVEGTWMIGADGGLVLSPDVLEECDCGECDGWVWMDVRRLAELCGERRAPRPS